MPKIDVELDQWGACSDGSTTETTTDTSTTETTATSDSDLTNSSSSGSSSSSSSSKSQKKSNNSEKKKHSKLCIGLAIGIPVLIVVIAVVVVLCVLFIKPKSSTCTGSNGQLTCTKGTITTDSLSVLANDKSVTNVNLGDFSGKIDPSAFDGLDNVAEISVSADNPKYKSEGGVLLSKDGSEVVRIPPGHKGNVYVGGSVSAGAVGSATLIVGATIKRLARHAFFGLSEIRSIVLAGAVETIEKGAFGQTYTTTLLVEGGETSPAASVSTPMTTGGYLSELSAQYEWAGLSSLPAALSSNLVAKPVLAEYQRDAEGRSTVPFALRYETGEDSIAFLGTIANSRRSVSTLPFYRYTVAEGDDIPLLAGGANLAAKDITFLSDGGRSIDEMATLGYLEWTAEAVGGVHFVTFKKAGEYVLHVVSKNAGAACEVYVSVVERNAWLPSAKHVTAFGVTSAVVNTPVTLAVFGNPGAPTVRIGNGAAESSSNLETISGTSGPAAPGDYRYECAQKAGVLRACSVRFTSEALARLAFGVEYTRVSATSGSFEDESVGEYLSLARASGVRVDVPYHDGSLYYISSLHPFTINAHGLQAADAVRVNVTTSSSSKTLAWTFPAGNTTADNASTGDYILSCAANGSEDGAATCEVAVRDKTTGRATHPVKAANATFDVVAGSANRTATFVPYRSDYTVDPDAEPREGSGVLVLVRPPTVDASNIVNDPKEGGSEGETTGYMSLPRGTPVSFTINYLWVDEANSITIAQGSAKATLSVSATGAVSLSSTTLGDAATLRCGSTGTDSVECSVTLTEKADTKKSYAFSIQTAGVSGKTAFTLRPIDLDEPVIDTSVNAAGKAFTVQRSTPARFRVLNVRTGASVVAAFTKGSTKYSLTYTLSKDNASPQAVASPETFKDFRMRCVYSVNKQRLNCFFELGEAALSKEYTGITLTAANGEGHTDTLKSASVNIIAPVAIDGSGEEEEAALPYTLYVRNLNRDETGHVAAHVTSTGGSSEDDGASSGTEDDTETDPFEHISYKDIDELIDDATAKGTKELGGLNFTFSEDAKKGLKCVISRASGTDTAATFTVELKAYNGELEPENDDDDDTTDDTTEDDDTELDPYAAYEKWLEEQEDDVDEYADYIKEYEYASEENGTLALFTLADAEPLTTKISVEGLDLESDDAEKVLEVPSTGAVSVAISIENVGTTMGKVTSDEEEPYGAITIGYEVGGYDGAFTYYLLNGVLGNQQTSSTSTPLYGVRLSCRRDESNKRLYTCTLSLPATTANMDDTTITVNVDATPMITSETEGKEEFSIKREEVEPDTSEDQSENKNTVAPSFIGAAAFDSDGKYAVTIQKGGDYTYGVKVAGGSEAAYDMKKTADAQESNTGETTGTSAIEYKIECDTSASCAIEITAGGVDGESYKIVFTAKYPQKTDGTGSQKTATATFDKVVYHNPDAPKLTMPYETGSTWTITNSEAMEIVLTSSSDLDANAKLVLTFKSAPTGSADKVAIWTWTSGSEGDKIGAVTTGNSSTGTNTTGITGYDKFTSVIDFYCEATSNAKVANCYIGVKKGTTDTSFSITAQATTGTGETLQTSISNTFTLKFVTKPVYSPGSSVEITTKDETTDPTTSAQFSVDYLKKTTGKIIIMDTNTEKTLTYTHTSTDDTVDSSTEDPVWKAISSSAFTGLKVQYMIKGGTVYMQIYEEKVAYSALESEYNFLITIQKDSSSEPIERELELTNANPAEIGDIEKAAVEDDATYNKFTFSVSKLRVGQIRVFEKVADETKYADDDTPRLSVKFAGTKATLNSANVATGNLVGLKLSCEATAYVEAKGDTAMAAARATCTISVSGTPTASKLGFHVEAQGASEAVDTTEDYDLGAS